MRDSDLTTWHAGEPLGQRIVVSGRVLDSGGWPVPDTLIEIWQTNAADRYQQKQDQTPDADREIANLLRGRTGLDEATARSAYGALHTYTIGFAALEASRAGWTPDECDADGLGRQLAAYTSAAQFTEGLRYLLAGIGRHTISSPES